MSRRVGVQLCYPFEERRLTNPKFGWAPPYLIQPKLDGDRCRALIDADGHIQLISSEGNHIQLPHIMWALEDTGLRNIELDGELYMHTMSHEQIRSRVGRTVNPHEDAVSVQLHIFDIVDEQKPQVERTLALMDLKKVLECDALQVVTTDVVNNLDQVMRFYDKYIEAGYEGFVLREARSPYMRKRNSRLMKFKPKKDDWYRVVGCYEEISQYGVPKGTLGGLNLIDDMDSPFEVGSGFTRDQRIEYWDRRDEIRNGIFICHVQYQALTDKEKVPRFPVFMELVNANVKVGNEQ